MSLASTNDPVHSDESDDEEPTIPRVVDVAPDQLSYDFKFDSRNYSEFPLPDYEKITQCIGRMSHTLTTMGYTRVDEAKYDIFHKENHDVLLDNYFVRGAETMSPYRLHHLQCYLTQYTYVHRNKNEFGFFTEGDNVHLIFSPDQEKVIDVSMDQPRANLFNQLTTMLIFRKRKTCDICFERQAGEFMQCFKCRNKCCRSCYIQNRKSMKCPFCRFHFMNEVILRVDGMEYTMHIFDIATHGSNYLATYDTIESIFDITPATHRFGIMS